MAQPFEQTIAGQGQQPFVESPTSDPAEIQRRTAIFHPFLAQLQDSLKTPQGQTAALLIARSMLSNRAPGEANGFGARLVDGALDATGAVASFNKNLSDSAAVDAKLAVQADQNAVQRRGQDVSARGQDLQAQSNAAQTAAVTSNAGLQAEVQREDIAARSNSDAARTAVLKDQVGAQAEANRLAAQDRQEQNAIREREILAAAESARLKYGLDADQLTQQLSIEAAKIAADAAGMGQGTFETNFRNTYNRMAQTAGKNGIPGAPPTQQSIDYVTSAVQRAQAQGLDPNAALDLLTKNFDAQHGIDAVALRAAVQAKLSNATPQAAPTNASADIFGTTPAAPAAPQPTGQGRKNAAGFELGQEDLIAKDNAAFDKMDVAGLEAYLPKNVIDGIKQSFASDPTGYHNALKEAAKNYAVVGRGSR